MRPGELRDEDAPLRRTLSGLPNSVERFLPESANEIAVGAAVMKWMQRWPLRPLAARKWFTTAESVDLPDYPVPPIAR